MFVAPTEGAWAMVAHDTVHWTHGFGHGRVVVKSDQAPALAELHDVSGDERPRVLEETETCDIVERHGPF